MRRNGWFVTLVEDNTGRVSVWRPVSEHHDEYGLVVEYVPAHHDGMRNRRPS